LSTIDNNLTDLAYACRVLDLEGHSDGTLGHLSLRDPEGRGFWLKRAGITLGEIQGPDDFILVDFDGKKTGGNGRLHAEWPIHSAIFNSRPEITAVGHTHPHYATAFAALGIELQAVTKERVYLGPRVAQYEKIELLIDTPELGNDLAACLGTDATVLMRNHGVAFVGRTVPECALMGIYLERACRTLLELLATQRQLLSIPQTDIAAKRAQILPPIVIESLWAFQKRKVDRVFPGWLTNL
jgi:L-fuculose-phosphate aldolase